MSLLGRSVLSCLFATHQMAPPTPSRTLAQPPPSTIARHCVSCRPNPYATKGGNDTLTTPALRSAAVPALLNPPPPLSEDHFRKRQDRAGASNTPPANLNQQRANPAKYR